jgi:hypothetical protein
MSEPTHEQIPIDFDPRWLGVLQRVKAQFGKAPNLESLLFLIGMNELGRLEENFSKEQKQDLMHIAVCRLLTYQGYYRLDGTDPDGWPRYIQEKRLDALSLEAQEELLKRNIIRYFDELENN